MNDATTTPDPSAESDAPRPKQSPAKKALFAAVTIGLLLGGAECAARIDHRIKRGEWDFSSRYDPWATPSVYAAHPWLGYALIPGASTEGKTPDGRPMRVTINEQAFRGEPVAVPKPAGTIRIACVGASTTFDTLVSADDRTWPARMEAALREALPERRIDVVNLGCPGWFTIQSLINYQLRGAELEPDIVLIHHVANDVGAMSEPDLRADYLHTMRATRLNRSRFVTWIRPPPFGWSVLSRSLLFLKARRKWEHAVDRRRRAQWEDDHPPADDVPDEGLRIYERNLRNLVAAVRASGAEPVLVTFGRPFDAEHPPTDEHAYQLGTTYRFLTVKGVDTGMRRANEVIRKIAREEGLLVCDQERRVPIDPALYGDSIHVNDAGAEVYGREAAKALLESGILDRAAR